MTIDEARDYIRTHHHAVLATQRKDGGVQMSPVAAGVDRDGSIIISTRETAMKTANLRRHPYAWLCVFQDAFYGQWVQVEGPVTIEHLPDAMETLVYYYRSIAGEHPDWDEYRAAMQSERRVIVRMQIERAGPNRQG